jgi:molecular chaperone DnaJ
MATKRDYYEVLSVSRDSEDRVIAKAYRKLAVQWHPDSNPGDEDASRSFKECAEAYEILSDKNKRARYDRFGHAGVEGNGYHSSSAEDIFAAFGDFFGGSGGMFEDMFGGRGNRVQRGADIRADVSLTLEEAANGAAKTIRFNRHSHCEKCDGSGAKPGSEVIGCPQCGGRGQVLQSAGILRVQTTCPQCRGEGRIVVDPCSECRGQGLVKSRTELEVSIPAGVDDGMRVRLTGEGEPSPSDGNDGPPGDCYVFISVSRHKLFHRDGQNLILEMPISYTQAALGADIEVPTLDGPDKLKIAPGTQSGEVFKLRGKGMPHPQGGQHGDLLVQTFIETPKKVSPEQEELLRKLAELEHTEVLPARKHFLKRITEYFATAE